jgi:hypothetical protein
MKKPTRMTPKKGEKGKKMTPKGKKMGRKSAGKMEMNIEKG